MRKQLLCAILAAFSTSSASAVPIQCAKHSQMEALLSEKYSEDPIAMGTVNADRFMQLFVSEKGTWTIVVTKTDGEACILAAGNNWEKLPVALTEAPEA